nr:hypothetical protein OH826_25145 [Streptomyces sp. NBC_00899]
MEPKRAVSDPPPRPRGELSTAPIGHISQLAVDIWEDAATITRYQRGQATREVLQYLSIHPGQTWQERWDASPLGKGLIKASELGARRTTGVAITPGVRTLFCLRVVQPSMLAFRRNQLNNFTPLFIAAQDDPLVTTFEEHITAQGLRRKHEREAVIDMCTLLTYQGVALADVTPAAILQYAHGNRLARCQLQPGQPAANRLFGRGMWTALIDMGQFPPSTPTTMRAAMMRGQRTIEELVDQYGVRDQAVRRLLIDYIGRRRVDLDYSSLKQLSLLLVKHFWVRIEELNPDQQGLRIAPPQSRDTAQHAALGHHRRPPLSPAMRYRPGDGRTQPDPPRDCRWRRDKRRDALL